jgi:predicted phage terminase large subunit-like protein
MTTASVSPWEFAAKLAEKRPRRYPTPGALASRLDPKVGTSPALTLIDDALVELMEASSPVNALAVFLPPQEGKSQKCSRRFPEWLLDHDPTLRIAIVSYEQDTALRWGRDIKQDIALNPCRSHLPRGECEMECGGLHIKIRRDSAAAGRWETPSGGGVYCVGIGGPLAGRPVDVLIVDDPVKDRAAAESSKVRDTAWDWWESVALTRLAPNGKVVLIQCMTGDTPVLMGDGAEKPLRDVRPGDTVATYEGGKLSTSTVRNWASQGPDRIFRIRMRSGRTVRANARHPFLTVDAQGAETWQRTGTLKPGDRIRLVTGANGGESPATQPLSTYAVTTDEIVEVVPAGREDVFDLQIDRTENFIANGLASHNTRWHEDDLAGRLASRPSPLDWKVLKIPAIADEPDDPLHRAVGEELVSVRGRAAGYFRRLKATMSSYVFSGIYQQSPTAPEGNFFRRATFRYWRSMEPWNDGRKRIDLDGQPVTMDDTWRFATVDVAASVKTSADWTVIAVWAVDLSGNLILLDRTRAHVEMHDHFALLPPLAAKWRFNQAYVEKQFYSSTFVKDAQAAGYAIAEVIADTDKVTRAIPAAGRVHSGKVWFPAEAPWLDEWCDELAIFPQGAHDDQVDVLAYAARIVVSEWTPAPAPARPGLSEYERTVAAAHSSATGNGHGDLDIMNIPF